MRYGSEKKWRWKLEDSQKLQIEDATKYAGSMRMGYVRKYHDDIEMGWVDE